MGNDDWTSYGKSKVLCPAVLRFVFQKWRQQKQSEPFFAQGIFALLTVRNTLECKKLQKKERCLHCIWRGRTLARPFHLRPGWALNAPLLVQVLERCDVRSRMAIEVWWRLQVYQAWRSCWSLHLGKYHGELHQLVASCPSVSVSSPTEVNDKIQITFWWETQHCQ